MTTTTTWTGTLTATSSIAHGGQSRGTITLLRRERLLIGGEVLHVPVVSGNALRGRLRRIGEELLRDALAYEGELPLAAAHALRGGGSLAKVSGEPLSGQRLLSVRTLVPLIAAFGAAAGGRIIDGALQVGRLLPHYAETAHLTGHDGPPMFTATQLECYTRVDEASTGAFQCMTTPLSVDGTPDLETIAARPDLDTGPMLYRLETFPAGTTFTSWIRLERTTALVTSFVTDILTEFTTRGSVGGRTGTGHGLVHTDWKRTDHPTIPDPVDWRAELTARRPEVLDAIRLLT